MSTPDSTTCLLGVAQEISATNKDTNVDEPREARDDETASVSGSSPGRGGVMFWQIVVQPGDGDTQLDPESGSGEADSGAATGVWTRVDPGHAVTMAMELCMYEVDHDFADGDELSCGDESGSDSDTDSDIDSDLELMLGLNDETGLWLLPSDSDASARVVNQLVDAGHSEHLRAYSAALITLAEGDASVEEVFGNLVLRTIQPGVGTQVDTGARPRSSRGGSTDMAVWRRAVVLLAATSLASSAISGYNAFNSPTSAMTAQSADLCSVQTQEES
ncbi:hypothetical protein EHS25_006811 [Saitozyma podzolica]|uniref:Uncharacterized protein n=1 Tax=Saitozyma podzolica TaxID=1890683 RepID=A0A427XRI8_9TREE|nr:hypothetical protein EHS25_006811 [Saitozyma podzolica]